MVDDIKNIHIIENQPPGSMDTIDYRMRIFALLDMLLRELTLLKRIFVQVESPVL
jgi:hypothetical protein